MTETWGTDFSTKSFCKQFSGSPSRKTSTSVICLWTGKTNLSVPVIHISSCSLNTQLRSQEPLLSLSQPSDKWLCDRTVKPQPRFVPELCRSCFSHLRIHTGSNTGLLLFPSKPAGSLILKERRSILGLSSLIIYNKCAEVPFSWLCQCILASQQFLQESWGFLKLWTSLTHRKPPGCAWTQPGFKDWDTFSVLEDP